MRELHNRTYVVQQKHFPVGADCRLDLGRNALYRHQPDEEGRPRYLPSKYIHAEGYSISSASTGEAKQTHRATMRFLVDAKPANIH